MSELYSRTVSAFPLSVGTSLALESLFKGPNPTIDPDRKIPQVIELSNYSNIWINVSTLIRNIASSVDRITYLECASSHVYEILKSEIEIIQSIFQNEGHGICKPEFFICSYVSVASQYKNRIKFRESSTVIQRSYDLKASQVLKRMEHSKIGIHSLNSEIKPEQLKQTSAMIMTHNGYDLVSYDNFRKLDLLESHTGILKSRPQWNTKYAAMGNDSLLHLPFNQHLLMIFGDKNQIEPQPRKIRKTVLDLSIRNKWTPFTTMDRIKQSYRDANMHPADLVFLLSL